VEVTEETTLIKTAFLLAEAVVVLAMHLVEQLLTEAL
jgi:hypothetical protein